MSRFEAQIPERTTQIETRAYQADPRNINSYIYQQSLPKNEIFPWILHGLDTQTKTSRPYHQLEPIIIPLESTEPLQDPRPHPEATQTSLSEEIDHLLNQEYAISASLSELDMMLRNLESEDDREEETNANEDSEDIWKLIDYII